MECHRGFEVAIAKQRGKLTVSTLCNITNKPTPYTLRYGETTVESIRKKTSWQRGPAI